MDLATAVLFFYLLFPTFSVQQKNLSYAFGKERLTIIEENEKCNEVKKYLGIEAEDTQIYTKEIFEGDDVPLPEGLEFPEYGPQSEGSSLLGDEKKSAEEEVKPIAEIQYLNSKNRLRLFEYGEEKFSVGILNQNKSLVSVNKDKITRIQYDNSFRIQEKVIWKNGTSVTDSTVIKKITYKYNSDLNENNLNSKTPPEFSKPYLITEEYPNDRKITETYSDEIGNPIRVEYSHFIDDPDAVQKYNDDKKKKLEEQKKVQQKQNEQQQNKTANDESKKTEEKVENKPKTFPQKKILDKKTIRTFDNENRVLTETQTTYFEIPDKLRQGKTIPSSMTTSNEYEYTNKSDVPNLRFYENEKLRMFTSYIDKDTYEQTMYFDNDYIVKTKYFHGRKVNEIIYLGATEIKRQKFE
ncbi:MAG: hypothetical protein WCQ67_02345 [Treponema sp.]